MTDPSTTTGHDYDVVVIGGGPVGKMAALTLGRRGHSVLVCERKETPYPLPRAVAHDAEIARVFQNVGMPVDGMPDAVEPYDDLYVWVNGQDETLHLVDWRGIDPSGWNNTYFYNQPAMEKHLGAKLDAIPTVTMRRGVVARVAGQDATGVDVELAGSEGVSTVRARFAIGADGANSAVRADLGIEWTDLGYFFDWLVIDVLPKPGLVVTTLAKQVADPARPTTVVPGGPGRRRWEFMRLEGETVEELTAPAKIWELLEPFGVTAENAELERGVVYTFSSGWATEWSRGRVLLAGDAAHLMPPFAGQGLAAGFRDCINLAWKLDLVLRAAAPDQLLDGYAPERTAHVSDFIDFSISLGRIICILDPEEARRRDEAMMAALASGAAPAPPPAPRLGPGLHVGDSGGYLSWQGQITTAAHPERVRFDDIFGAGALIVSDAAVLSRIDEGVVAALARLGIVVASYDAATTATGVEVFADVDGTYATWLGGLEADVVLVRPDFYVFGSGSGADDARRLADEFITGVATGSALKSVSAWAVP
jgi:2-polyprenyl-6-methoxyphenol hydroxylase-like FAD-dependent oxidoreductase